MDSGNSVKTEADRKQRGRDADRRRDLLDLAIGVVADRGLASASFRNLAAEAGTSTTVFTYEFGSREELLSSIVERAYEVAWETRGFDEDGDEADPLGHLRRAARLAIQTEPVINPWQRTYDRLVFESPYEPGVLDQVRRFDKKLIDRYVELIDQARERGQIDPGMSSEDALFMVWALGDGLNIHRYAYPAEFDPDRMKRLFDDGFDRIMGCAPGSAASW